MVSLSTVILSIDPKLNLVSQINMNSIIICILLGQLLINVMEIKSDDSFRLPSTIVPDHYQIITRPDFYDKATEDFMFYGSTFIHAHVTGSTDLIKVHFGNLTLTHGIEVENRGENVLKTKSYDSKRHWFVLRLKKQLIKNDKIIIKFFGYKGPITHSLNGLYYYTRMTTRGTKQFGVTTQLETTFARHVFPCFDEPQLKATFEMRISRKPNYFALSNARLMAHEKDDNFTGWVVDKFDQTPKMSTYLVVIIVTQYKGISSMIRGVNFTMYYPPGKSPRNLELSMKVVNMTFPVLEDYFDFAFPMTKLDSIGFRREDYEKGGMENFGMITYRDLFIYADPTNSRFHPYLSSLTVHELVHQWFGNILTMKWWDDLWLNEGLTEYFSLVSGKWQLEKFQMRLIGEKFVLRTMDLEIKSIKPPVYVSWAKTPSEIKKVMNEVTYKKGAMTMQMAELLLGEKTFRNALRSYIKEHAFKSVTHQNLWDAFQKASQEDKINLNISKILTPWIKQSGFPVVSVKINYNEKRIDFSQKLFPHTPTDVEKAMPVPNEYNFTWPIPMQWRTKRGNSKIQVKFGRKGSLKISEELNENDWLVVNPEAHFYYIVNYEKKHWELLGFHLKKNHTSIDVYSRVKLIFDVIRLFSFTKQKKGNYIDAATTIKVLQFARMEQNKLALRYLREIKKYGTPELQPILDLIN